MAMKTAMWAVDGSSLQHIDRAVLDSERRLEDWIAADLSLLGEELVLIGRQIRTTGGPLDILAMDAEGDLVVAELKRDRTPREVVAQVLDYASWVSELTSAAIDDLCRQAHGRPLREVFRDRFGFQPPESAGKSHRMLVVAAELDDSSERILRYLQEHHEIDINAVFFSVYTVDRRQVLVRAWLADPQETQERAERRRSMPWSGMWFVNNGIDDNPHNTRDWELCRTHGFLSAGGGEKYWRPLLKLQQDDVIAVYQKGRGYVGVGTVTHTAIPADEFRLDDGRTLADIGAKLRGSTNQPDAEYVIRVRWSKTFPVEQAKTFRGVFANQNIVCKLRHEQTIAFIEQEFGAAAAPQGR